MEARGSEDSFDSRGFVITTIGLCVEWREFGRLAINNNGNYTRKIDKISAEIVGGASVAKLRQRLSKGILYIVEAGKALTFIFIHFFQVLRLPPLLVYKGKL